MGTYGLFVRSMIAVYEHVYVYWFAHGLWGIGWNGFGDFTVVFFPIHDWKLLVVNVCIGRIHAKT